LIGGLSLVLLIVLAASRPSPEPSGAPEPLFGNQERGDPLLAQHLADHAAQTSDSRQRLALLLAAHVVAPDRATHRLALAGAVLASLHLSALARTRLDLTGPIRYAALSSDGSYLITSTANDAQLWQTLQGIDPSHVDLNHEWPTPVTAAAAGGTLQRTTLLTASPVEAAAWRAVPLSRPIQLAALAPSVDAFAVTGDGAAAVTVTGTTATLWNTADIEPVATATATLIGPTTTTAIVGGDDMIVAAGHPDGSVSVLLTDGDAAHAGQRDLTSLGGAGSVTAVAISADHTAIAAVTSNGTMNVWTLRRDGDTPLVAVKSPTSGGGQVWLGPSGDDAILTDATGTLTIWSLADPAAPSLIGTRRLDAGAGRAPTLSADGRTAATIGPAADFTLWDTGSIVDILADPTPWTCHETELTEQDWRTMVPDPAYSNPCPNPAPPSIGTHHA
jgi:hypothetical protein